MTQNLIYVKNFSFTVKNLIKDFSPNVLTYCSSRHIDKIQTRIWFEKDAPSVHVCKLSLKEEKPPITLDIYP